MSTAGQIWVKPMPNLYIIDFIRWALTHAKRESVPSGALLPVIIGDVGKEPWHYLYGSIRVQTTAYWLSYYYEHHYWKKMTHAKYVEITSKWESDDYATDCQGLLDAYLTYVMGIKTDISADINYRTWCTDKGLIAEIDRPFVIGEAVFEESAKSDGTRYKNHVGWVCGFAADGVPLVIEARGIAYGVVVTRMDEREWTHRGLMTNKFEYPEEENMGKLVFEVRRPMLQGDGYEKMQAALNAAGFTDANGNKLDEDGKWGAKSQQAFDSLIAAYTPEVVIPEPDEKHSVKLLIDDEIAFEEMV